MSTLHRVNSWLDGEWLQLILTWDPKISCEWETTALLAVLKPTATSQFTQLPELIFKLFPPAKQLKVPERGFDRSSSFQCHSGWLTVDSSAAFLSFSFLLIKADSCVTWLFQRLNHRVNCFVYCKVLNYCSFDSLFYSSLLRVSTYDHWEKLSWEAWCFFHFPSVTVKSSQASLKSLYFCWELLVYVGF